MGNDLNTLLTTWIADMYSGQTKHADGTGAAPSLTFTTDTDTGLFASAANTMGVAAAGAEVATFTTRQFMLNGANGGNIALRADTELMTVAAAATTDSTANLLPAGAIILGVSCRVTTIIPTATSFVLAGASAGGPFTGSVLVAAGSVEAGTLACPYRNASAQKVRLTITGSNPANNTGRVRITVFYLMVTPPTS